MSLFTELKRRRVIRVTIAYIVASWVILQVADVVFPIIPLPEWSMRFLLAVLVLAFPIVAVLAWIFQVRTDGRVERERSRSSVSQMVLLALSTLLLSAGLGWLWTELRSPGVADTLTTRPRVAVLPLRDMSPQGDKAYFSDGIHEELIARLSEIRHIAVTSRTSVDRFRKSTLTVPEIASELGVQYILEGSVRHSGDRVRITLQFIDATSDEHLWVRDFDELLSMDKLFDIQQDVSTTIASLLRTQLTPSELDRLAHMPTDSVEAYEAHLKGVYYYRRYNVDDLRLAVDHFRKATELDPDYARSWAGLANAYMLAATTYGWLQPDEAIEHAKEYGARALQLNQYDGSTISLIGDIAYWYDYDAKAAEARYLEGITVDPHHIGNRLSYAYLLSTQGRFDKAFEQVEFWLDKEPNSAHLHVNAGWRYFDARQYETAIEHANRALAIEPGMTDARWIKGYSLVFLDRLDEAEPLTDDGWTLRALWLMRSGREDEARAYVASLDHDNTQSSNLMLLYAAIEDHDRTLEYLHNAIDEHSRGVLLIKNWEFYDPMRGDPRFQSALNRIGLD